MKVITSRLLQTMTAAINLQMALFGGLLKLPKRRLNRKGFSLAPN